MPHSCEDSHLQNVEVEAKRSINEVQCARCDGYSELLVEDLTVQLSGEQLWLPGFAQSCRELMWSFISTSTYHLKNMG